MNSVTCAEFEKRLTELCAGGKGASFPKRQRDRNILFRCMVQSLEQGNQYSEQELNGALQLWLADVGSGMDIDHVTLRRYLVDEGYLLRNANGTAYTVFLPGSGQIQFEDAVSEIDSAELIRGARERAAIRKSERIHQE